MILDELLSDRLHAYSMNDLWERTNDALVRKNMEDVSKRCIEKDILCIENEPFYMELDKWKEDGKLRYRYADKRAHIFRRELKKEERLLLGECLNTLGQFDGLSHFEWIESYRMGLKLEKRPKIISFSNNPYLQGSNLLGTLFDYIANRVVVRLSYHTFDSSEQKEIDLHPYLLKQYNDRWFLFGAADEDDKILCFALDRINEVEPLPARKYRKCKADLNERFEDIIGITFMEENPVEPVPWAMCRRSPSTVPRPLSVATMNRHSALATPICRAVPSSPSTAVPTTNSIANSVPSAAISLSSPPRAFRTRSMKKFPRCWKNIRRCEHSIRNK